MERIDIFFRILEVVGAAIVAGWISRVLTIRARVRQEKAVAAKAETEVTADQIENIQSIVEKVYKPTIETLQTQVAELRAEVADVRAENEQLKAENAELRNALREIRPDVVPSKRSINASNQARNALGQFVSRNSDEARRR